LIHFSGVEQSSGTSEAASLVTECRQRDSGSQRRIPDMLVGPHANDGFCIGRDQAYLIRWDFRVHLAIVWRISDKSRILKEERKRTSTSVRTSTQRQQSSTFLCELCNKLTDTIVEAWNDIDFDFKSGIENQQSKINKQQSKIKVRSSRHA
jgi:hypothetical protein